MTEMLEQSLLERRTGSEEESRLHMLETLREYGLEQLAAHGEVDDACRRHARYFLHLAEALAPQLDRAAPGTALERLHREQDNLRAALAWCLSPNGDVALGLRLAAALWPFWYAVCSVEEGLTSLRRALAASAQLPPSAARAEALRGAAELAKAYTHYRDAQPLAEESRRLWRALGDRRRAAEVQVMLGDIALRQGDRDSARFLLEESVATLREHQAILQLARALIALAWVDHNEGRHAATRASLTEALTLVRAQGNPYEHLRIMNFLFNTATLLGDTDAAEAHLAECLALCDRLPEDYRLAEQMMNLGWTLYSQSRFAEAAPLLERGLAVQRAQGRGALIAWGLNMLGDVARAREEHERAAAYYAESLELFRREQHAMGMGAICHNQGHLALAAGDAPGAATLFVESLRLFREVGFTWGVADCLAGLGGVATLQGRPRRAVRLFGATQALHDAVEAGRWSDTANRLAWERNVARAQMQLAHDAWAAAWAEGNAMDLETAVAYALGDAWGDSAG